MQKFKLTETQRQLLQLRQGLLQEAVASAQRREGEVVGTLNIIASELGIPETERSQWRLSQDGTHLERTEPQAEKAVE